MNDIVLNPIADGPAEQIGAGNQVQSKYRDKRRNVEINVGKACNNKCVFCLDGMPKKEDQRFMDYAVMQEELRRWRQSGHDSVGFLGGEPTMMAAPPARVDAKASLTRAGLPTTSKA